MRLSRIIKINDPDFQQRLQAWASSHDVFCILNSNQEKQLFSDSYSEFDLVAAVGALEAFGGNEQEIRYKTQDTTLATEEPDDVFKQLKKFHTKKNDWLFGFLTYDLKNNPGTQYGNLKSENKDGLRFPDIHFFQPRFILNFKTKNQTLEILFLESHDDDSSIQQVLDEIKADTVFRKDDFEITVKPAVSKEEYISTIAKIKQHIQSGDIYEMNYCMEFFSNNASINPLSLYTSLNRLSPMPFSCFYRLHHHYLMCASPERFLAKRGTKVISQPIKGTIRRGKNSEEDELLKQQLKDNPKEQSENVMIVDLVRNDLSRTAKKGSVNVEELFGIYTFGQLHQMISTVVSEKRYEVDFSEVIRHAFPMGSMTGAPKIRAMQLIEHFEKTKRGLYSGSVGYISPEGNFDFNVVIRSILWNSENNYLSFMVGSAITANSEAEKEYEECLLKAGAMLKVLSPGKHQTVNQQPA